MNDEMIFAELVAIHERLGKLDRIEHWMDDHSREDNLLFLGDGSDDNPGLIKKVDRLEVAAKRHKWFVGLALGALLAALVDPMKAAFVWLFAQH